VLPVDVLDDAYVTGFRLVVPASTIHKVTTVLGGGTIEVASPVVVADLVGADDKGNDVDGGVEAGATRFRISGGVLTGRVSTSAFFAGLGLLKKTQSGTGYFCQDSVFAPTATQYVCNARDISSDPRRDFGAQPDGAPYACDGVSLAVKFSASWAQLGDDYTPDASDAGCPDSWGLCP
jgi:hypothetical protein